MQRRKLEHETQPDIVARGAQLFCHDRDITGGAHDCLDGQEEHIGAGQPYPGERCEPAPGIGFPAAAQRIQLHHARVIHQVAPAGDG